MAALTDRIKTLSRAQNLTLNELAEAAGVSRQTLYYWSKGRRPELESVRKIAAVLRVSPEVLLSDEEDALTNAKTAACVFPGEDEIPRGWNAVPRTQLEFSAGGGAYPVPVGQGSDYLILPDAFFQRHRVAPESCLAAEVTGDSMVPTLLPGDQVVFVKESELSALREGRIYVFCDGSALRIKRLSRRVDGSLLIRSDNPTYSPEVIPVNEQENVRVYGRVIWSCHDF